MAWFGKLKLLAVVLTATVIGGVASADGEAGVRYELAVNVSRLEGGAAPVSSDGDTWNWSEVVHETRVPADRLEDLSAWRYVIERKGTSEELLRRWIETGDGDLIKSGRSQLGMCLDREDEDGEWWEPIEARVRVTADDELATKADWTPTAQTLRYRELRNQVLMESRRHDYVFASNAFDILHKRLETLARDMKPGFYSPPVMGYAFDGRVPTKAYVRESVLRRERAAFSHWQYALWDERRRALEDYCGWHFTCSRRPRPDAATCAALGLTRYETYRMRALPGWRALEKLVEWDNHCDYAVHSGYRPFGCRPTLPEGWTCETLVARLGEIACATQAECSLFCSDDRVLTVWRALELALDEQSELKASPPLEEALNKVIAGKLHPAAACTFALRLALEYGENPRSWQIIERMREYADGSVAAIQDKVLRSEWRRYCMGGHQGIPIPEGMPYDEESTSGAPTDLVLKDIVPLPYAGETNNFAYIYDSLGETGSVVRVHTGCDGLFQLPWKSDGGSDRRGWAIDAVGVDERGEFPNFWLSWCKPGEPGEKAIDSYCIPCWEVRKADRIDDPSALTPLWRSRRDRHGFAVKSVSDLPDVPGRLWHFAHAASGAELVWLERADPNCTFAIAFRTVPTDDTGVAHVMEHSLLCGSERYPVKAPFLELKKRSLATFLNAMTYPDKTVYPVASRERRDFLNLVDVYLDATLHPLAIRDDWTMRQEGWHYEDDGTNLVRKGVVYAEMQGSWANLDTLSCAEANRLLYPDTVYGRSSGGDPAHIPELTFDAFRAFYRRHYHPSNALLFLDGAVDLDATLKLIGSRLAGFGPRPEKVTIPRQRPVAASRTVEYPNAAETNRTVLMEAFALESWADRERLLALEALSRLLVGSNSSPLKRALLEAGLCEDVSLWHWTVQQPTVFLRLVNVRDGKADEARRLAFATMERMVREGLPRERLASLLDRMEFERCEKDTAQRGLYFLDLVLDSWLYGGDPAANLSYREVFAALRSRLGTDYFARVLGESLLANPHHASLVLRPSATLAARRRAEEAAELAARRRALGAAELGEIARRARELKARQSAADRPEDLAKVPQLRPQELSRTSSAPGWRTTKLGGATVVRPAVAVGGICYLDLCFSLAGLSEEEFLAVPYLASAIGQLGTRRHRAEALHAEVDRHLGGFWLGARTGEEGAWLVAHVSALESRRDEALALAREMLLETDYGDAKALEQIRSQRRDWWERDARASGGRRLALSAARRGLSERGLKDDLLGGVSQLRWTQAAKAVDLAALAEKVFVRARLTVGASENLPDEVLSKLVGDWPVGVERPAVPWKACPVAEVGFETGGDVGYAAMAARLPPGEAYSGAHLVAAQLVTLEWLWPEVRVKGGAYGARFEVSPTGAMAFSSWRDSNPARSFGVFAEAGKWLVSHLAEGGDFSSCQLAAIQATEPCLSPRSACDWVLQRHFDGLAPEFSNRVRGEILEVTTERLAAVAESLAGLGTNGWTRCAFAGGELLRDCGFKTETVQSPR